jgi:hypothetical protein
MVIPNSAIYQGSYVYVVDEGILKRREINTRWQNESDAVVSDGLKFGEQLVTTALGQISSGTPVTISNKDNQNPQLADLDPERRRRLQERADAQGVSVEQLMAERRKNRHKNQAEDKS